MTFWSLALKQYLSNKSFCHFARFYISLVPYAYFYKNIIWNRCHLSVLWMVENSELSRRVLVLNAKVRRRVAFGYF